MRLAEKRGELISKKVAAMQVATLPVACRQRLLAIPDSLPRCREGRSAHEMRELLLEAICDALREIAKLPATLQAAARQEDAGNGQGAPIARTRKRRTVQYRAEPDPIWCSANNEIRFTSSFHIQRVYKVLPKNPAFRGPVGHGDVGL
jgi:hypothetical protein